MPELTIQPDAAAGKDSRLYETNPNNNFGASVNFITGEESGGQASRGLIQFDISTIPSGAIISSAVLSLVMDSDVDTSGSRAVSIHRVTRAWGEGAGNNNTATSGESSWNHSASPTTWTTAGGDYDSTQETQTSVGGVGTYTFTLTDLVNEWLGGENNYGILIKNTTEGVTSSRKRFETSDSATAGNRPKLVITYELPGGGFYHLSV